MPTYSCLAKRWWKEKMASLNDVAGYKKDKGSIKSTKVKWKVDYMFSFPSAFLFITCGILLRPSTYFCPTSLLIMLIRRFSVSNNWACILHTDVYMCCLFVNRLCETGVSMFSESALPFCTFCWSRKASDGLERFLVLLQMLFNISKCNYAPPCVNREKMRTLFV